MKVTEGDIMKQFQPFGFVQRVLIDKKLWQALIRFETIEACTKAFAEMHGQSFLGKRIAVSRVYALVTHYKSQPWMNG